MNSERLRWGVSVAAAVLVVVLIAPLFRGPGKVDPVKIAPVPAGKLKILPSDTKGAFAEGTSLADPTPLFLPTKWNTTQIDVPLRRPGEAFSGFEAKRASATAEIDIDLPAAVNVPPTPALALARPSVAQPELGVGRAPVDVKPWPGRGAFVEIVRADGRPVAENSEALEAFKQELARVMADARPPTSGIWQPVEFLAAVDPAGLVGPLTAESRRDGGGRLGATVEADEVVRYFQRYLMETLRIGLRLSPGFYRISVGP